MNSRSYYAPRNLPVRVGTNGGIEQWYAENPTLAAAWMTASFAGGILGAYHGYKRNDSIGWAIGWSLLGSLFPFITIPISLAQGFGERAE